MMLAGLEDGAGAGVLAAAAVEGGVGVGVGVGALDVCWSFAAMSAQ